MNRAYVFLLGCIGFRLFLSYVVKNLKPAYLPIAGAIALKPAIAFLILYLFDLRKTGIEAGGKIWWGQIRPIHTALLSLFAFYAFRHNKHAWKILVVDAIVGIVVWWMHYYTQYL